MARTHGKFSSRAWTNLLIASVAMVATMPSRTFGLGLITESIIRDFGVTRVEYATINLWSTIIGAAFCLPVGRLLDQFGARSILAAVASALGASILLMTGPAHNYALLFIAYTLLRGFGQSALSVVSLALVGKWFGRRLPVAMGIFSILISLGFVFAFLGAGAEVLRGGWRSAWSWQAYALIFGLAPLAAIFARSGPKSGEAPGEFAANSEHGGSGETGATLSGALRTAAFWILGLATASYAFISSALLLFQESILQTLGFGPEIFQRVQAVSLLTGLAANFVTGWLAERVPMGRLLAFGMALLATLCGTLPFLHRQLEAYVYGAGMGIAGGIATVIFFSAWGKTYGQKHVGHIQGAAQLLTVLASAFGPLVLAAAFERTGTYFSALEMAAPVFVVLAIACWVVKVPQNEASARAPTGAPPLLAFKEGAGV